MASETPTKADWSKVIGGNLDSCVFLRRCWTRFEVLAGFRSLALSIKAAFLTILLFGLSGCSTSPHPASSKVTRLPVRQPESKGSAEPQQTGEGKATQAPTEVAKPPPSKEQDFSHE